MKNHLLEELQSKYTLSQNPIELLVKKIFLICTLWEYIGWFFLENVSTSKIW